MKRNPKFEDESLEGVSWTRVVNRKFPHRRKTPCCDGMARAGDVVVTIAYWKDGEYVGTNTLHVNCLRAYLNDVVPEDKATIRERHLVVT